jgi:hypothetical protein
MAAIKSVVATGRKMKIRDGFMDKAWRGMTPRFIPPD